MCKGKSIDKIRNKKDTEYITAASLGGNYHSNVKTLNKLSDARELIKIEIPTTNNLKEVYPVFLKTEAIQNSRMRVIEENNRKVVVIIFDPIGTFTSISIPN